MRETIVVSHVTLVMSYLVVMLGCVRAMEFGMVLTPCVIKVTNIHFYHTLHHIIVCLDCLPLSNPANGTMQCSLGDDEVESCIFTCNNGYQLIGSHTRTCQGNGSWNGTDSVCKRGIQAF